MQRVRVEGSESCNPIQEQIRQISGFKYKEGSSMNEHVIQSRILLEIGSIPWLRVWRNNTGALLDRNGKLVKFGLQGSADILGIMKPQGRFLAIEVKTEKGRQSESQKRFQQMVEDMGGLYILARSPEDVTKALGIKA